MKKYALMLALVAAPVSAAAPVNLACQWPAADGKPPYDFEMSIDLDHQTVTYNGNVVSKSADITPRQIGWTELMDGVPLLHGTIDRETLQIRSESAVREDDHPLIGQCKLSKAPKTAF